MATARGGLARYALHGLCVESEIPLQEPPSDRPVDISIRWGEAAEVPATPPRGRVLVGLDQDVAWYWLVDTGQGYTIRIAGLYEFRVSRDRRVVVVHGATDADPDLAPIFLSGIVLALILSLDGKSLLHASAVQVDDSTAALAGDSGMGKSTITALLCHAGAALISDDLLRIDVDEDDIVCFEGTSQIRLRKSAGEIAGLFPAQALSVTADERISISVEYARGSPFSLDAVVIPSLSKTANRVSVTQLRPPAALAELLRYPRVAGWQIPDPLRGYFQVLAEVSARVPVLVAEIPWGPPFDPGIAPALLREIGFRQA